MSVPPLRALKFGGTSVGDVERIRGVVDIVRGASAEARCVVVVSAMAGATRTLVDTAAIAVTTERYVTPLTIRGAGDGREVTAAGVLADILRCASEANDGS